MDLKEAELRTLLDTTHSPVVVDCFATWCGPCRNYVPVFEKTAKKLKETAQFVKIDIDECTQLVEDLNIDSVPSTIIFKNSKVIARKSGGMSERELEQFVVTSLGQQ